MARLYALLLLPLAVGAISAADLKVVAGGIVEGFIGDKPDIEACIKGMEGTVTDVEVAVKDFEKKTAVGVLDGLKELAVAVKALPAAMTACKATVADVERIAKALEQFNSPKVFVYHVAKDLVVNGRDIFTEIKTAVTDYKAQQYSDFGLQVGTALRKLIVGVDEQFAEFEQKFHKTWKSEEERQAAKLAFEKNLHNTQRFNEADDGSATYSHLTPFADLTPEEFSQRHGLLPNDQLVAAPLAELLDVSTLPDSIDWVEKGAVNDVKNQGTCGSCWAFATVANIEGAGFVTTGKLVSLSEQELVDCDTHGDDQGCGGGLPSNAYKYMVDGKTGLVPESDYPYTGTGGGHQCKLQVPQEQAFITSFVTISPDEDQMAAAVVKYGPLAIGINAGPMQFYFGGVSNPWTILCNPKQIDHGVAIVGFGVDGSKKYWKIRNSWGKSWGEKGYYRIIRGVNKCGLTTMVTSATGITIKPSQVVV